MSDIRAEILERADSPGEGGDGRTVALRIMPWGQIAETPEGRETFERGAFAGVDPTRVTVESQRHGGVLVGRGYALEELEDAAYLHTRISQTGAGDELLTLIQDGVVTEASVAFLPIKTARRKGVLVRQAADLRRVAILERGSYQGAGVVAVRSAPEVQTVVDTLELPAPANDADVAIRTAIEPLLERMGGFDTRITQLAAQQSVPPPSDRPESWQTRTLGDLLLRSLEDTHAREQRDSPSTFARAIADAYHTLRERALLDQITTPNTGLIPPAHLTEAVGIINEGRPTVEAFGGARSLPETGMDLDWPQLVPLAGRAIAEQVAQKTEVVSRVVSFTRGATPIRTYAGASDISVQLIRRSSPSYRELYAQVMLAEYARVTEDVFQDAILAAAGIGTIDYDPAADTDGKLFRAALFAASVKVKRATGAPATAVVASEDLFLKIGTSSGVVDPGAGPSNAVGTASARSLEVTISGITVILGGLDMPAGTAVAGNGRAASWYEDGPFTIEAPDAAKLGVNVAYWGLGATAVKIPAGIIKIYNAP